MPNPPNCDPEIFESGTVVFMGVNVPSELVESWVKRVASTSDQRVDWHFVAGRAIVKALGDVDKVRQTCEQMAPEWENLAKKNTLNLPKVYQSHQIMW